MGQSYPVVPDRTPKTRTNTAAKGAEEAGAAPRNVSEIAAEATKKVSGDVSDTAQSFAGHEDDETDAEEPASETP
jgi:hypothetical protein